MRNILREHGITYDRPGHRLECEYDICELGWKISLTYVTLDRDTLEPVKIFGAEYIRDEVLAQKNAKEFVINITRYLIERMALHETMEWFKVDDKLYSDPHK